MAKTAEDRIRTDLKSLRSKLAAREGKYIRNMNRYMNNGVRREDLWTPYVYPLAYVAPTQDGSGVQTQFNVIKSCVDTIASKISQANVRPFFNPVNGDYDAVQTVSQMQQYFDIWLDEQHAYPKSVMCFRDASVYDIGVMAVDPESQSIDRVPPWEYFVDPGEYQSQGITRVMRWRKYFPLAKLRSRVENPSLREKLSEDPTTKDEYTVYWDLYNGRKWQFFGRDLVCEAEKLDYEQFDGLYRRPFIEIYYTKPMKGFFSVSLADDLYPIQRSIDEVVKRMDDSVRKTPIAMIMVPVGSGLKSSILENGVRAYTYNGGAENGRVEVIQPDIIKESHLKALELYMNKAYDMAGISQLSAQSRKPTGLDSGKALDTMENIESDRFNVQLQQFTHFLVDCARVCIDTFPRGESILPKRVLSEKITWGEVRKHREEFSIQFSAASSLSKDPEEKLNQIEHLMQMGFVDKEMATQFLELPDLQGTYTAIGSSYRACRKVVSDTLKTGGVEFDETLDIDMLKRECVKMMNQLSSAEGNEKYITRLKLLLKKVCETQAALEDYLKPQLPQPVPPPVPERDEALDSGQTGNLANILSRVNQGELVPQQAVALIMACYPKIKPEMIQAMMTKPPQEPLAPAQSAPGPPMAGAAVPNPELEEKTA